MQTICRLTWRFGHEVVEVDEAGVRAEEGLGIFLVVFEVLSARAWLHTARRQRRIESTHVPSSVATKQI